MKITLFLLSLILLMQFPGKLYAHHAMEYIELESYNTARKGEFVFHLHYDYFVDDNTNPSLDHWEFTPGISFGLSNRLMLDIHTHFAKFWNDHIVNSEKENYSPLGPSPFFEADGVYFPLGAENIIVKTGLLIGNSRNERLNTTLMYRF